MTLQATAALSVYEAHNIIIAGHARLRRLCLS
jgi:hypothetical protein